MRSRIALMCVPVLSAFVALAAFPGAGTAGAVSVRTGATAMPFRSLSAGRADTGRSGTGPESIRNAPGENPPGRVTQIPGQDGYEVPSGGTTTVQTTVTVPTITCNFGSNDDFGDVETSDPSPGITIGFSGDLEVSTELIYNCAGGSPSWDGWSTDDPNCSRAFGEGICYYDGFTGGAVSSGDQVEISASLSASSSSTTITDLTSGASLAFTGSGFTTSSAVALVDTNDLCMLIGGDSEPCSVDDYTSPIPPPGYADFTPISFTNTVIDGTGLGTYLAGSNSGGWLQLNNVWGSELEGQTSYVGSGENFTVTNAQLTLPGISLSTPRVDQPTTGTATLTFTATLAFTSPDPIYVDYTTQDGSAIAGTNYTAISGTLLFPSGTLTQQVSVTVLPGAETGGDENFVYFSLPLTNPSYAASGATGEGIINEGPIVTGVSPAAVPLNGGPATAVTVTGYDLGDVVSGEFCPVASGGGGACIPSGTISGVTDTSLTVLAPDATDSVDSNSPTVTTDTIVTDSHGVSSPISVPADTMVFGCDQQRVGDGAWQVAGCLTDEGGGDDVTQQASSIDGINLTASSTDDVSYETDSESVSTGATSVSLPISADQVVQIFTGQLVQSLTGAVTFAIPANTQLAGIGISGSLTLTPTSLGQASGTVTATLPPVLGGTTGTLSFTTTTGVGLTGVTITVPHADFMQLFSLSNVTMSYASSTGTWSVAGTATTGGTTSTTFSGSMVYTNNTLKSASLKVGAISLAGLLNLSNLTVSYKSGAWSGSATVTQGKTAATVSLVITGTTLTSAEIKTGPVSLFGVVNLNSFDMTYASGNWSLAVTSTLPGGGSDSAILNVANGIISSASLSLSDVSMLKTVTINSALISYSATAPNTSCNTVTGTEIWCGSWDIAFPETTGVVSGITGSLAFADGSYASGSVGVSGSVPLLDGVFLTQLGAMLQLNPQPAVLSGTATISFGPVISNTSALSLTGTLTRTFPTSGTGGSYLATGTVTALAGSSNALVLGSASVTVPDSGATTVNLTLGGSATAGLSVSVGSATATITGVVNGTFTDSTFLLTGSTSITVPLLGTLSGSLKADNTGVAACAMTSGGSQVGFEYYWNGTLDVFDSTGCSEHGF